MILTSPQCPQPYVQISLPDDRNQKSLYGTHSDYPKLPDHCQHVSNLSSLHRKELFSLLIPPLEPYLQIMIRRQYSFDLLQHLLTLI